MDSTNVFCPNEACPARGQVGQGNITVHDRKKRRYRCTVCQKAFSERKGTPFYRLRTAAETVILVLKLLSRGCPVQAIVFAFEVDERTVMAWLRRGGRHCPCLSPDGKIPITEENLPRNLNRIKRVCTKGYL